jgi:hypothetical protein
MRLPRWAEIALVTLVPLAVSGLGAAGCLRCNEPTVPDAGVAVAPPPPPPLVVRDAGPDVPDASDAGSGPVHHAGKRPAPTPAPGGGGFKVEGSLAKADAEKTVHAGQAKMRACYEAAHAQDAALKGRVVFRLSVDDRGRVTLGEVVTSTLGGDDAEMCMIRATRDFKFPAGGGPSTVSFQMNFGR